VVIIWYGRCGVCGQGILRCKCGIVNWKCYNGSGGVIITYWPIWCVCSGDTEMYM